MTFQGHSECIQCGNHSCKYILAKCDTENNKKKIIAQISSLRNLYAVKIREFLNTAVVTGPSSMIPWISAIGEGKFPHDWWFRFVYSELNETEHWTSLAPVWTSEMPVVGNSTLHCHTAKDLGMRWVRKEQQYLFAYLTACWSHVIQKVEQYSSYVPQRPSHNSLSSNQTTPNGRSIVILRATPDYVQQRHK